MEDKSTCVMVSVAAAILCACIGITAYRNRKEANEITAEIKSLEAELEQLIKSRKDLEKATETLNELHRLTKRRIKLEKALNGNSEIYESKFKEEELEYKKYSDKIKCISIEKDIYKVSADFNEAVLLKADYSKANTLLQVWKKKVTAWIDVVYPEKCPEVAEQREEALTKLDKKYQERYAPLRDLRDLRNAAKAA